MLPLSSDPELYVASLYGCFIWSCIYVCETETRDINRVPSAFGRGSSSAEWGSTGLTNEVSERGEVKGRTRETAQNREGKYGEEGREMEGVLSSLNRFLHSNFTGLAHFLSGSFIEEQPVGVRTQINREKEQSPVFPLPSLLPTLSVPLPLFLHLLNPLIERLPQRLT